MARALLVCAFFTVILSAPAQAARFSGDYLLQVCASDKNGKELTPGGHIACQAYIAGLMDYHNLLKSMGAAPGLDFCVPEQTSLYAVQSKVTSYIFRNQQDQGPFIASPGVAMALFMAYPCDGGKKAKK